MELSSITDVQDAYKSNKSKERANHQQGNVLDSFLDIVDMSQINFDSEETWLYEPLNQGIEKPTNLHDWLYEERIKDEFCDEVIVPTVKPQQIDTRTFTRPKKRFTRPSIEQYEQMYNSSSDTNEMNSSTEGLKKSSDSSISISKGNEIPAPTRPLQFDLAQPTSSYYFDNVLIRSAELDSFQNMSPPSLVNSLCSSTFANLMESSFIKNDPVLREIRDTDYTETVLLQDTEAPLFQSITESCSSVSSDTPENFLKRVSVNGTFRKSFTKENDSKDMSNVSETTINSQAAHTKDITSESSLSENSHLHRSTEEILDEKMNQSFGNVNGTYRRTPKLNGTFRKSDVRRATVTLSSTFELSEKNSLDNTQSTIKESGVKDLNEHLDSTHDVISNSRKADSIEDMKKQLTNSDIKISDLNRLSYCIDDEEIKLNSTYTDENSETSHTVNIKRSSLGSADSLDRMSSLSSSSKGSSKMLNMADIDAIVEMQERSLNQVMSTPKPNIGTKKLWENNFISPIPNNRHSDSDMSSSDEYRSVKSALSSKVSLENYVKQPVKSMGYIRKTDEKFKTQRSAYTLSNNQKQIHSVPGSIRGSYTSLKTAGTLIGGSQSNLCRMSNQVRPQAHSNLKTMAPKLKGSYTSLRPISANLPVAPPVIPKMNSTTTLPKATNPNVTQLVESQTRVVEVQPMPRDRALISAGDSTFVKPHVPRASGLPRPTGIPRPASKIPGPRNSNIRPTTSRSTKQNDAYH